ncbi:MAG: hypothetical protein ACJ0HF_02765 [Candidatus Thalassarchaeum sp.]
MPTELVEELAAGLADEADRKFEGKQWWYWAKTILFYGPAVLIAIYLLGFFLGLF